MIEEFEYNGKAMGTEYSIAIVSASHELSDKLYEISKTEIEKYEKIFSRFLKTSELSILNENKNMIVSQEFFDVTLKARELFEETRGVFNPLIQVSRLGYNKNYSDIKNDEKTKDESIYDIDFSNTQIDRQSRRIQLNKGQKLDYGGFLKGYLAEIIAKQIKSYSVEIIGVIVNLGGDIHTQGLDKNGNSFVFNIYNPISQNNDIEVTLYNESLATSGTYKRSWLNFGKKIHHILDIFGKQNPENDVVSASVVCEDGAISEAYAKVFISIDYKNAMKLLGEKKISTIIIKNNGQVIKNII
ncbi:MAG: FAD:protein FMN transferase [Candidatus Nomurabacteria bacterium]|nr:FAD:protein FMN transferase [Candidatus Nomurabacteria bacterium]